MKKSPAERRKAERIRLPLKLEFKGRQKALQSSISLEDISGLGIRLTSPEPFGVNEKKHILIHMTKEGKPFRALCRVRWCRGSENKGFKVGLEFQKIKDKARFFELLCEKMLELFGG